MTPLRKRSLALASLFGAASFGLACSALLDLQPPPDDTSESSDGGPDASGDGGMVDPGCGTRYVSDVSGKDSNDGCSVAKPKKTITAALAAVETAKVPGYVIKVCAGTYAEDGLVINLPGSLLGSFDCATFKQQAAADKPGGSTIRIASPSSSNKDTLRIFGLAGVTAPAVLEGFKVVGAPIPGSWAVHVGAISVARITSCVVNGADTTNSRALYITAATPEVSRNVLVAGSAVGSVALEVIGGTVTTAGPHVHDNTIGGGSSTSSTTANVGSQAVNLYGTTMTTAAGSAFERNIVTTQNASGTGSASGIVVGTATVDIVGNAILATGLLDTKEVADGSVGVYAGVGASVRILKNRIFRGGKRGSFGDFRGVTISGATSALIADNMIYAGQIDATGKDGTTAGIYVTGTKDPRITGNTIYTGYRGGGPAASKSSFAVYVAGTTTGAVIQNNVLAGASTNDWGVKVDKCPDGIALLGNNLFVGLGLGTLDAVTCVDGGGGGSPKDISSMAGFVTASVDNLEMRDAGASCGVTDNGTARCLVDPACTNSAACLDDVLASWQADGFEAFDGGWTFTPSVSCRIAQGGADLSADPKNPTPNTDYFGKARATPPAIGAAELGTGACLP